MLVFTVGRQDLGVHRKFPVSYSMSQSNRMFPISECPTEKAARSVQEEELQKLRSHLGEEKVKTERGVRRLALTSLD